MDFDAHSGTFPIFDSIDFTASKKIKLPFRYPQPESPGSIRISCASTAAQDQPQEYTAVTNQIEPGQVAAQTAQVKLLVSVEFLQYHHGAFAQEFVPKWVLQLQWNL